MMKVRLTILIPCIRELKVEVYNKQLTTGNSYLGRLED